MTAADFRRIALSLDGAEEGSRVDKNAASKKTKRTRR